MFQGFTDETYEFFMAIAFNNNMQFFHENHDWYLRAVRQPCLELADALGGVMEQIDEEIERRPNRVVSRINRDIRFSRDKSPYRDHLWLSFQRPGEDRGRTPGFWFEISPRGASWGMGAYDMRPADLEVFREMLLKEPARARRAFREANERFAIGGARYKRLAAPQELDPELKPFWPMRDLFFERNTDDLQLLASAQLPDMLAEDLLTLKAAYHFMLNVKQESDARREA